MAARIAASISPHDEGRRRLDLDRGRVLRGRPAWPAPPVAALRQQSQLVQHARDVRMLNGFRQHADGAERARLAHVQLAFLRGVHDHRDDRGVRVALDRLDGLEAVHARHQVIHEDHVRAGLAQKFQRVLGDLGGIHLQPVAFQHAAQYDAGRARVVDDQGSLGHEGAWMIVAKVITDKAQVCSCRLAGIPAGPRRRRREYAREAPRAQGDGFHGVLDLRYPQHRAGGPGRGGQNAAGREPAAEVGRHPQPRQPRARHHRLRLRSAGAAAAAFPGRRASCTSTSARATSTCSTRRATRISPDAR